MVTLSPTKARANLTSWLEAAINGEDVGILFRDRVVALRPVKVESTDYAWREYGALEEDVTRAAKTAQIEIRKDRKTGKLRKFNGDINAILGHSGH